MSLSTTAYLFAIVVLRQSIGGRRVPGGSAPPVTLRLGSRQFVLPGHRPRPRSPTLPSNRPRGLSRPLDPGPLALLDEPPPQVERRLLRPRLGLLGLAHVGHVG